MLTAKTDAQATFAGAMSGACVNLQIVKFMFWIQNIYVKIIFLSLVELVPRCHNSTKESTSKELCKQLQLSRALLMRR